MYIHFLVFTHPSPLTVLIVPSHVASSDPELPNPDDFPVVHLFFSYAEGDEGGQGASGGTEEGHEEGEGHEGEVSVTGLWD